MCTRCPGQDPEICSLCGGTDSEWSKAIPSVDADTKGEVLLKLEGFIEICQGHLNCTLEDHERNQYEASLGDFKRLYERAQQNILTNSDWDYIDCI